MDRAERVAMLKREGRHQDAIPILSEWLDETEKDPLGVSAWPYQQLAIIHRKLRDPAREVEVLERFARQRHGPDARSLKLFQRLVRAYELQGELEEGTLEGRPIPVHRSHGMPVDAVPSFRSTGLVVDVETTGLSREDELIEFGGVLFSFSRLSGRVLSELDRYQGMREPGRPIHPGAARAHGLTLGDLRGKALDHSRINAMISDAEVLIAHNASFDRRFIIPMFPSAEEKPWQCSMRGYPWTKRGYPSAKLDDILGVSGIVRKRSHRALDDADALLTLLARQNESSGRTYLAEVMSRPPLKAGTSSGAAPGRPQRPASEKDTGGAGGCLTAVVVGVSILGALAVLV